MSEQYDLIILGGGPAGMAAGIYGGRARLKTLILEKGNAGGRAYTTREIVNYPGIPSISGPDLAAQMRSHAESFGVEFRREAIREVDFSGPVKEIRTRRHSYEAKAVIVATGTSARVLGIPGEKELTGLGVAYCATCDAEFFQDQTVVVVGSGDQGIEEGMYITRFASRVIVIVLHEEGVLDCNKESARKALSHPKMEFCWNSVLDRVCGEDSVTGVDVKNVKTGEITHLPCQGVFFFVGMVPETRPFQGQFDLDRQGWALTNDRMETSCPGVYAAGDVRAKYLRQVCTGVADGAIAATAAERYIEECDDFQREVVECDQPVILEFWSPEFQGGLDRLAAVAEAVRNSGGAYRCVEVDLSRKQHLARRYQVTLDEEHPAAALVLDHGTCLRTLDLSGPISL